MTQKPHSPLPWTHKTDNFVRKDDGYLRNAAGKTIADFRYKNGDADLPLVCRAVNNHDSLLKACKAQHQAIDTLLAALIEHVPNFMPTKSAVWPALVQGNEAIAKAEGGK